MRSHYKCARTGFLSSEVQSHLQCDCREYKHLQCDKIVFRIINPDTLCGRITNAPELVLHSKLLNFPKISVGMNDNSRKSPIFVKNNHLQPPRGEYNSLWSYPHPLLRKEGPGVVDNGRRGSSIFKFYLYL